jgi:hypothetical protein
MHHFHPHNRLPARATATPPGARGADRLPFARPDVPQIFGRDAS